MINAPFRHRLFPRIKLFITGSIFLFLFFLGIGLQATPAHAAIALVQATSTPTNYLSTAATSSVTFASNTTAGDAIIVAIMRQGNSAAPMATGTISDTAGNVFVLATSTFCPCSGDYIDSFLYYATNIKGSSDTINFNWTSAPYYNSIAIHEYSGVASVDPLDQINTSSTSATSVSTGNVTTTVANELLFSFGAGNSTSTPTISSGWTTETDSFNGNTNNPLMLTADQIATSTGSYQNTFGGFLANAGLIVDIATFKSNTYSPHGVISFTASSTLISSSGTSILSWNIVNASSVAITPGSFSTSTLIGSTTISPTSTTLYTLTAANINGTSTATTSVTVDSQPPTIPQNLTVSTTTFSSISLSWASSTDDTSVAGYDIYRC